MKVLLWFAGVCPEPGSDAAWAFVCRDKLAKVANRYLHAGSGMACRGTPASAELGAVFGLGYGLRWLADQGKAGSGKLVVYGDCAAVLGLCRGADPPEALAKAWARVRELLAAWPEWVAEAVGVTENQADELARGAWESATGKPYPARPTRRRRLPGLCR